MVNSNIMTGLMPRLIGLDWIWLQFSIGTALLQWQIPPQLRQKWLLRPVSLNVPPTSPPRHHRPTYPLTIGQWIHQPCHRPLTRPTNYPPTVASCSN